MLVILTTHPIQYQVPIWQMLAREGRVPFEVWYLSDHGAQPRGDREFGRSFAWDIDLMRGYPHRFLDRADVTAPDDFWACHLRGSFAARLREAGASALWLQGWQVAGYWQAAFAAHAAGIPVWLRGESNDVAPTPLWKRPLKRVALRQLFGRVERFLYIGAANRRLYRQHGVGDARLQPAPYAVDNARFAAQAAALRGERAALRKQWGVAEEAFCILFCGKFIAKKRPLDLVTAAKQLTQRYPNVPLHLLFAGAGALEGALREASAPLDATFTGFLNQTEVSRAYVAADALVLPSGPGETWGLVVNEALASGLPCVVSDACGVSADLGDAGQVFRCGDVDALADAVVAARVRPPSRRAVEGFLRAHDFRRTVDTVSALMAGPRVEQVAAQ